MALNSSVGAGSQRNKLYFGKEDQKVVETALLRDNPSVENLRDINKYIGKLD